MAEINKPKGLTKDIWASTGDVVAPPSEKVQQGWTAEVPPFQYENWIQNRNDASIAHITQHGISAWDGGTEYIKDKSYVQGSNGVVYKAVSTNTNQDPIIDSGANWVKAFAEFSIFGEALFAVTGYQKLPGGLIVQWGRNEVAANTMVTLDFPIPFPNGAFIITGSVGADFNTAEGADYGFDINDLNRSQYHITNGNSSLQAFSWIALGN